MSFVAIDGTIQPHLVADYLPQPQICTSGCSLYAALGDPRTFPHNNHSALMYTSTDGTSWSLIDESHSPLFAQGDGEVQVALYGYGTTLEAVGETTFPDTFDPNSNTKTVSFDPSTNLWLSTTRLTVEQGNTSDFLSVARWFSAYRPDGSYVVVFQENDDSPTGVQIKKRTAGGTWSTLATLTDPGPIGILLQSAVIGSTGIIYLLLMTADVDSGDASLYCVTISIADIVSSLQLVEANITSGGEGVRGGNYSGFGDIDPVSGEISFVYVKGISSFFNGYGNIRLARAMPSLSPSWTLETVISGTSPTPSYPSPQLGVVYLGSTINVFYTRPTASDPSSGTDAKLYQIVKSGTWGSQTLLYTDTRGANGQFNLIRYNGQIGILWAVQGKGVLYSGIEVCSGNPLNVSVGDSFNFSDISSPQDSLLIATQPFFPSDCGHGNLIVESDEVPVNPGLGSGCGGGYDSLVEAD